jgi:hypothetical protein
MTFDQWMHLLAVLAWPAVALIAGVAWVHGCRLIAEVWLDAQESRTKMLDQIRRQIWSIQGYWEGVNAERLRPDPKKDVAVTSERALLAVLAARGGFPAKQAEAPGRALVREVREMYQELDEPTPRPEPALSTVGVGVGAGSVDDFDIEIDGVADDLFAEFMATDEDAAQAATGDEGDLE